MKKSITCLLIVIIIIGLFYSITDSQTINVKDYIHGKLSPIFSFYLSSLEDLNQYEKEFIDLLGELPEEQQIYYAKEVFQNGFSLELLNNVKEYKKIKDAETGESKDDETLRPTTGETIIGPVETVLEKLQEIDYGHILIPEELFPEGKGLPIPIYVPPVENDSNVYSDDWPTIKEIKDDEVIFSQEKLLRNLVKYSVEHPGDDLILALSKSFAEAFDQNAFLITIQRSSQGEFRAIIQITTDEMNVIRAMAGDVINSPSTGVPAIEWSRYLQERFSLPSDSGLYRSTWIIDKNHKEDPYVSYLSLSTHKNAVLITPKVYMGDNFKIMREVFIVGPIVLDLKGRDYINTWSYLLPIEEPETLKILELLPISPTEEEFTDIPSTATATALVIDHSGSMGDKRKLELAQEAARSYIDSVPEEDYVSVAGFSTDASSIVGLSSIKTSKEKLKQCILSLHSTSSTNIGAGLRVGMEQIFVEGQKPQKPIILLLSDGMHNTGELWPWVEECKRKQVKVYTVAFGSDADQVTLCKIAYQTGGRCFPAGIKNLSHIYHKANIYVHNNSTLFASSDWLKPGQELKYKVDVPSDFKNLTFFTNWQGSSILTVIVKPDGSLIYPSSQMGDYQKGNTYSIFRVPAETGIWELRLSGQDLPQEGEQINVSISGKSEIYSNFLTFQPEYKQGQRVLIRVEVADVAGNQKIPLENIKVKAKIEGPTPQLLKKVGKGRFEINPLKILMGFILKRQEIDLYDDGAHDDYDSKDGIYGGTFLGGDILGPYLVTAIIEGQSQGKIISRQIQESFQIGPIQNNKLTISDFIQIKFKKK